MILKHCRPGTEVITPLGRTAVIVRQRGTSSNVDIFDRVELRYLDVQEDKSGHRGNLVDLQPKLLRLPA